MDSSGIDGTGKVWRVGGLGLVELRNAVPCPRPRLRHNAQESRVERHHEDAEGAPIVMKDSDRLVSSVQREQRFRRRCWYSEDREPGIRHDWQVQSASLV